MTAELVVTAPCRVLLVDDHALFRGGVATVLGQEVDILVVAQASGGEEALRLYREHRPDVVLLDLQMPGLDGVETLMRLRHEDAEARVVMLTTYFADEDITRALQAGAKAYLLKGATAEELVNCIRDVRAGQTRVAAEVASKLVERFTQVQLTVREYSVLKLIASGKSNRAIATALKISDGTVKVHITHLFEKLRVSSRTEAIAVAARRGLVRVE